MKRRMLDERGRDTPVEWAEVFWWRCTRCGEGGMSEPGDLRHTVARTARLHADTCNSQLVLEGTG